MSNLQVLVIEDDQDVQLGYVQALGLDGIPAQGFDSVEKARRAIGRDFAGIIVSDIRLPGMDGLAFMQELLADDPDLPVILITGHGDIAMAVQAMRDGAYDFIQKPFLPQVLVSVVQRAMEKRRLALEVRQLRRQLAAFGGLESRLIGNSNVMAELRRLVQGVAATPTDILINGETGAGKELLARCLHDLSGRTGPFVALNCGGLPETLFDSEMFGHEAGAFSGASKQRIGKIEYAQNGTLFLDEIESMSMPMQIKLLRVLQERVIERLGSNRLIPVDFRVIAATKADLSKLADEDKFRADLYFRLNVVTLDLPPLRARREDIPLLFDYFVSQSALRMNRPAPAITAEVVRDLMAYHWPGNVRELRNQADRFLLDLKMVPGTAAADSQLTLHTAVESFEKGMIAEELRKQGGNVSKTAEVLKIAKTTLFDKIRKYDLEEK